MDQHLLAFQAQTENKFVYSLSFRQAVWWAAGFIMTAKLLANIPPIPYIGWVGYIFHIIPFGVCMVFSYVKHPRTDWHLSKYIISYIKCKSRKRKFT